MNAFTAAALGSLLSVLIAGCASAPPMPPAASVFHDAAFAPPATPVRPEDAMAISPAMRAYLARRIVTGSRFRDPRKQLFDALYREDELKLEYDATETRTAAQAFEARSGNCLALVMMTAAFAKELGLTVRYQAVLGDDAWDRAGDLYVEVGHVNLTLGDRAPQAGFGFMQNDPMTIDFVPPRNARALRTRPIAEPTLIAMYLNNRAVELLASGHANDAYWWAREAIRVDPAWLSAYITLGVIYRNLGHADFAEQALQRVAEREPENTRAMSNRVLVLRDLGRQPEADALQTRLVQLEPHPPYSYFHEGMAALRARRFESARRLFEKEIDRAPYQHEFQFWLAIALVELHDPKGAEAHLRRAMEVSTTRRDHDLYAAKLGRLKAMAPQ
jgi:tetratricopeptide (TPR) repeat protein